MYDLYTVRKSAAQLAARFGVSNPMAFDAPEEVYPTRASNAWNKPRAAATPH